MRAGASAAQQSTASQKQASEASEALRKESDGQLANRSELVKDLWGQLPQRMREQLLQSSDDEFLPKYRQELEEYFRALAEEQAKQPADR